MAEGYVPQVSCPLCLIAAPAMEMVPVTIDRTLEGQPKTVLLCQNCIGEVDYSAQTWRAMREQVKEAQDATAVAHTSDAPVADASPGDSADVAPGDGAGSVGEDASADASAPPARRSRRRAAG